MRLQGDIDKLQKIIHHLEVQGETREGELIAKDRELQEINEKTMNVKQQFRREIKELKFIIDEKERKSEEF